MTAPRYGREEGLLQVKWKAQSEASARVQTEPDHVKRKERPPTQRCLDQKIGQETGIAKMVELYGAKQVEERGDSALRVQDSWQGMPARMAM